MHGSLASLFVVALAAGCAASGPSAATQATAQAPPRETKAAPTARPTDLPGSRPGLTPSSEPARPAVAPPDAGDYLVAPRDQLFVQIHGHDDLTRTARVSERGTITLPLVGEIRVAGLTGRDIETAIENALKPAYLKNPRVSVTVSEFRGRQFAVVGAVNQPGSYPLRSNEVTLREALSEAHGARENAGQVAYIRRAKPRSDEPQPLEVDIDGLFRAGQSSGVMLEPGDSVYVPEASTFYVSGEVEKRGAYTLRRGTTVAKAIAEAGGVTKRASDRVTIVRTTENGNREEIAGLDLDAILEGDSTKDLPLRPHDVVVVPASRAKVVGYTVLEVLGRLLSIGLVP